MAESPTDWQPFRLSCLRKPPHRLAMFSTTTPWCKFKNNNNFNNLNLLFADYLNVSLEAEKVDILPVAPV